MSDDKERIAELEAELAKLRAKKTRNDVIVSSGWSLTKWLGIHALIGGDVFDKWCALWDEWEESGPWPADETKEFFGSLWNRLTSVGWLAVAAVAFPAIFSGLQFYHMARQTQLIANQEKIIDSQTEEMTRQNHLAAYEQTSRFKKDILEGLSKDKPGFGEFWPQPDRALVHSMILLGKREHYIVRDAMKPLLRDKNGTVAQAAALVLCGINEPVVGANLRKCNFEGMEFNKDTFDTCYFNESNFKGSRFIDSFFKDSQFFFIHSEENYRINVKHIVNDTKLIFLFKKKLCMIGSVFLRCHIAASKAYDSICEPFYLEHTNETFYSTRIGFLHNTTLIRTVPMDYKRINPHLNFISIGVEEEVAEGNVDIRGYSLKAKNNPTIKWIGAVELLGANQKIFNISDYRDISNIDYSSLDVGFPF